MPLKSKLHITKRWIFDCYSWRFSLHSQSAFHFKSNVQFAAVLFNYLFIVSILFRSIRQSFTVNVTVNLESSPSTVYHPRAFSVSVDQESENESFFICACRSGSSADISTPWMVCKHEKVSTNTDCKSQEQRGVPACAWHPRETETLATNSAENRILVTDDTTDRQSNEVRKLQKSCPAVKFFSVQKNLQLSHRW